MADELMQRKNALLVSEVKKHPCLYNAELPTYTRKDAIDEAWTRISEVVDLPIHTCKARWKNLRVVFIRRHRNIVVTGKKRKPYYLYNDMQFLIPHVNHIIIPDHDKSKTKGTENDSINESNERLTEEVEIKNESDDSNTGSYTTEPVNKSKRPDERSDYLDQNVRYGRTEQVVSELNNPYVSFLNSLLPELNELTTQQFNMFKRRLLALIDEIKGDVY